MMKGQGVYFDVIPSLDETRLVKAFATATSRAETAANDMVRAISGHDYFASPTTQLDRWVAKMETGMRAANTIADRTAENLVRANDRVRISELQKTAAQQRAVEMLDKYGQKSSQYLQALASQERAIRSAAAATRDLSAAQAADTAAAARKMEAQRRQDEATTASAAAMGRLGTAVTGLTVGVGAGMAAAFTAGASKAGDLEKGLRLLQTGAKESTENIAVLRKGVLDLQSQWGTPANDQLQALLIIERAGYHGQQAMNVLTAGVQAAKAEGSNLRTVVEQLTTTMNDFDVKPFVKDVNQAMSTSVEVASMSKVTLEEYARAIGKVEESAKGAGLNMVGLNAAFAAVTQHGITADDTAQLLLHGINTLQRPSIKQSQVLNQFGISTAQVQGWLADPNLQLGGTVEQIQKRVDKYKGADGRIHLDPHAVSIDARAALDAEWKSMTDFQRTIASRFAGHGEINAESFNKVINGLGEDDRAVLSEWRSLYDSSHGFNRLLRSGLNPSMSPSQAQQAIFGDAMTTKLAQYLLDKGGPLPYDDLFRDLGRNQNRTDPNGQVQGSTQSQDTLKAQLSDLRGALNTDLTKLGDSSQGPLTSFVRHLVGLATFLGDHQGVLQYGGLTALGLTGALGLIKGGNALGGLFGADKGSFGRLIGRGIGAGARGIGTGAAALYSRAGTTAWMARTAALDGLTAASGWIGTNARGLAQSGSSVGGQIRNAAIGGVEIASNAVGAIGSGTSKAFDALKSGAASAGSSIAGLSRTIAGLGVSMATNLKTQTVTAFVAGFQVLKDAGGWVRDFVVAQKAAASASKAWAAAQLILDAALSPVGLVVIGIGAAIGALAAGFIYAYNHSERFRDIVTGALSAVGRFFSKAWTDWIKPVFDGFGSATTDVTSAWQKTTDFFGTSLRDVRTFFIEFGAVVSEVYGRTLKVTFDALGAALGKVRDAFSNTVTWVKTEWGKLGQVAATPVKWIITHVYDGGIRPVWNRIDSVFGGHHQLPEIQFRAAGGGIWAGPGTIPGYAPGIDDVNAKLSKGESVLTPEASKKLGYSTIAKLNAESGRRSANDLMGQPIRAAGGLLGDLGSAAGNAWNDITGAAGLATKLVSNPVASVRSLLDKVLGETGNTPGDAGLWRQAAIDIPRHFLARAVETAKGWIGFGRKNASGPASDSPGTPWVGSGTLDTWISQAIALTGVDPATWGPGWHTLVMRESSGNPNAINLWDSNAKAGHPSKGLTQLIDSNFQRYRDPRLSDNIFDPIANLVADAGYIKAVYGDITRVQQANSTLPAHGYAGGGIKDPHLTAPEKDRESGRTTAAPGLTTALADRTAIDRAWAYIRSVAGTAYSYGGLDCSMFLSGIYQSLLGRDSAIRAFNTTSDFLALGFRRGLGGIFSIGVNPKPGELGHMAGTFDGADVESNAAHGVTYGPGATGAADAQFPDKYYLPGNLFSPPLRGAGAKPTEGQSQANKLHAQARKLRDRITTLQKEEQRANDAAAQRDQDALKADDDAAKYTSKAAQQILDADKKKYLDAAQKARDRGGKAREAAQKERDRAATYHQRAQDAQVQADQADRDAGTAWSSPSQVKPRRNGSGDPNHLLTPKEAIEQLAGTAVDAAFETLGLSDTVFADPNQSYLLRIGNAILNPFAKVPPQQQDQQDSADQDSLDAEGDAAAGDASPAIDGGGLDDTTDPAADLGGSDDDMAGPDSSLSPDTDLDSGPAATPGSAPPSPGPNDVPSQADQDTQTPDLGHFARPDWLPGAGPTTPLAPSTAVPSQPPLTQQLLDLLQTTPQTHDAGGLLQPGLTLVNNATGLPEAVLAPREKRNLEAIARLELGQVGGNPRSWVHIENLHQYSGEDGHDTGRRIAREMAAYSAGAR
ncbi:phage tail tape measure protein [Nocardia terpenica]|nr:phage tail tape measure protein [Nocardia terpenica]